MRQRRLSDIARITGGTWRGPDVLVSKVVVHSSEARAGALFVALKGRRTDGHRFVNEAAARGAAALVERRSGSVGSGVIVPSTGEALLALAAVEREELGARVVAVTGSTGKTTTKDMAATVVATRFATHASPASFNNQVGVPLTVLGAPEDTEVLVCEVGAGTVGEIASLCQVIRPHVGIVTNVGLAHVETFGSPAAIGLAKGELPQSLSPEGVAVLNADDPAVSGYALRTPARVITFGRSERADVRAEGVVLDEFARARFTLVVGGNRADVALRVIGEHMVENALAAAACGLALRVGVERSARALDEYRGRRSRMELRRSRRGFLVLDDAYNASPASMLAALRTTRRIAQGRRVVAVLGPMAELGPLASAAHDEVGRLVAELGFDLLVSVGEQARPMSRAARRAGLEPSVVVSVSGPGEAVRVVRDWCGPGDIVLVKASRIAELNGIAEELAPRNQVALYAVMSS